MTSPVRLLLVGSNGAVRRGLKLLLSSEKDIEVVGQTDDGDSAIATGRELHPTVVLVDLESIGEHGLDEAARIKRALPAAVAVLSLQDDGVTRRRAELAGLHFVSKQRDSDALLGALRNTLPT